MIEPSQRTIAKNEIGELIIREILNYVQDGNSPVQGKGSFKKLSDKYAKLEKGGDKNPNLELNGDMLDALTYETRSGSAIEFGIFDKTQAPKADGHNNFSGDSKLPLRRFIPDEGENLKRDIESKIETVIQDYVSQRPQVDLMGEINLAVGGAVTIADLFDSPDFFKDIF